MSAFRAVASIVVAAALVAGTTGAGVARDVGVPDPSPERVLFIGNSHTARHGGLDWLVGNLVAAEETPRPFKGRTRTASGVTLEYHYRNGATKAIRTGGYDVIVLQEYLPGAEAQTTTSFMEHSALLHEVIESSGADTVLFMTWPQGKRDWAKLDDFVAAHRRAEAGLGVPVAPVGVAFANAAAERPDLALIGEDTVHATWEGAYLVAATVYATLFDRSPEGLSFTFGISDEDAAFLQRIAWQTLTDWRAGIPAAKVAPRAKQYGAAYSR